MEMCKNIQWWYQTGVIETRPVTPFIILKRKVSGRLAQAEDTKQDAAAEGF